MNCFIRSTLAFCAALACAPGAMALQSFTQGTNANGGSSVVFVAMNTKGSPLSVLIDLGYLVKDFDPTGIHPWNVANNNDGNGNGLPGLLGQPGQTVVWDFTQNTISVNGAVRSDVTPKWSSASTPGVNTSDPFGVFTNNTASNTVTDPTNQVIWGVVGGGSGGSAYYLSSGNPTPTQFSNLTGSNVAQFNLSQTLLSNNAAKGTIPVLNQQLTTLGGNAVVGQTANSTGFVGASGNFATVNNGVYNGNWQGKSTWNALVSEGTASGLQWVQANNTANNLVLNGQFTYSAGQLTWQTTAVPVPPAYLLAGLGVAMLVAWRRRAGPSRAR